MDVQHITSGNYSHSLKRNDKNDQGYMYKKSSFQYSNIAKNTGSNIEKSAERNIDQLDELLEDLKNERQHTMDIELVPSSMIHKTIERQKTALPESISRATHVIQSSQETYPNHMPNEIGHVAITNYSTGLSSRPKTLKMEKYQMNENISASEKVQPQNKIYESSSAFENIGSTISTDTKSSTSNLTKDLQNIALSDDILPLPGTKVTTTVRTYTYEIPADAAIDVVNQRTLLYKNNTIKCRDANYCSHQHLEQTIPSTVVYNTESYSTIRKNDVRPIIRNYTNGVSDLVETKTIRDDLPPLTDLKNLNIYKANNSENVQSFPETIDHPTPYKSSNYREDPNTNRFYYSESSNVIRSTHGLGNPGEPNDEMASRQNGIPSYCGKYSSQNRINTPSDVHKYTKIINSPQDHDVDPSSLTTQPAPFPVDDIQFPAFNGNPPRRVDDLMQAFGNSGTSLKSEMEEPYRKREIETAVAIPKDQKILSVNKAGNEVYYPPNHEMILTNREELKAGSAAGGRWAKGSGMYEYESGYKSKSKSKSGGAVVPVCLPLCCAMPCSIM